MDKKLGAGSIISISLMLFAMFFGAGNMIFPPMVGHLGGTNYVEGILGFMFTDAGLSILGIAAIVFAGSHLNDLGNLIGPKFSVALGLTIYMLIGPLFALPRTGTVSYAIAALPFLGDHAGIVSSLIFTASFFLLTYVLAINPNKIVDIVGKVLTPVLLISIAIIFILSVINPVGPVGAPKGDYATKPFFTGFIEGYLALDGLAALAFGIVVITAIRNRGVGTNKGIIKYTLICGVLAGVALGIVYLALGYVGAQTSADYNFADGGSLLNAVVYMQIGKVGNAVLGVAVLLACLTTSIGLATSFSDYLVDLKPNWSYKKILTVIILFSFAISNVGLAQMISITLPLLIAIYPPVMALTVLSFFKKFLPKESYTLAVIFSGIIGICDGLKAANISLGAVGEFLTKYDPLYTLGIGWIVPALIGVVIGLLPFVNFMGSKKAA